MSNKHLFAGAVAGSALFALVQNGGISLPQEPVCMGLQTTKSAWNMCVHFPSYHTAAPAPEVPQDPAAPTAPVPAPAQPGDTPSSEGAKDFGAELKRQLTEALKEKLKDPCRQDELYGTPTHRYPICT